ncbi:zygote-specific protein [Planoprotostelium fungivorum]|uniref:Zygote-specific protein n=1 Tax=Planoprotostelium fungivorum TaxID=1890364 RepID=A0A2P6N610_9EUKA|nr:zygote-specific protein [Planoprotostelium fungivorum]
MAGSCKLTRFSTFCHILHLWTHFVHAVKLNHARLLSYFKTTTTSEHTPNMNKIYILCLLSLLLSAQAGPVLGVFCISACNAGYAACCAGFGVTAGTFTLGAGVPVALATCSVAQGVCMTACVAAPTP